MRGKKRGKLIVIEGGDGSGKATQASMLADYFKKKCIPYSSLDFPQYDTFYGEIVAKFLRGEFGKLNTISPYLVALTFALDRLSVREKLSDTLKKGINVIANRYVTSNIAHQGAKIDDINERKKFIKWIERLEYDEHKLPKEDIVLYLKVPSKFSALLSSKKNKRKYLNGKNDIQETDHNHRCSAEIMYDILSQQYKHWVTVDCVKNGKMKPKEIILNEIVKIIEEKVFIKNKKLLH